MTPKNLIEEIRELETSGVLGREKPPSMFYWSWPIIDFHRLPQHLKEQAMLYNEIRF